MVVRAAAMTHSYRCVNAVRAVHRGLCARAGGAAAGAAADEGAQPPRAPFSPCVCAFQPKHAVSYLPLHVVPRSHPGKPRRPYSTHSLCSAVCAGGGQTVGAGRWLRRTNAPFPSPPSSPCVLCHVVIVTLLRPSTRPSYCVLALPVVSCLFPPKVHTHHCHTHWSCLSPLPCVP